MYSNANREEDLDKLLELLENNSKISIKDDVIKGIWFSMPNTLGDLIIIQIHAIVQKKIRGILFDESLNKDRALSRRGKSFLKEIKSTNLIEHMCDLLDSNSFTKKDISILVINSLSECRHIVGFLMNKETIGKIIRHVNSFKKLSKIFFELF